MERAELTINHADGQLWSVVRVRTFDSDHWEEIMYREVYDSEAMAIRFHQACSLLLGAMVGLEMIDPAWVGESWG